MRLAKIGIKDLAKETLDREYFGQSEKSESLKTMNRRQPDRNSAKTEKRFSIWASCIFINKFWVLQDKKKQEINSYT